LQVAHEGEIILVKAGLDQDRQGLRVDLGITGPVVVEGYLNLSKFYNLRQLEEQPEL
jgi:hypothetical protein